MLRKLFLTGLLQLVDRGSAFQVMMGCSVSFIFASLQHRVQPYVKPEANTLKSLVEGQIFLTFLISFIIRTQNINVERFGPEFFGAVLVVSLGMVILAAAVLVAKQVHHKRSFEARLLEGIEFETVTATGGSGTMTELPSIITAHESVDTSQRP
jgi:Ca2+/H+ antiporter